MAYYRCSHCDNLTDNDWHPCESDPDDDLGLICPACGDEANAVAADKKRDQMRDDKLTGDR